MTPARACQGGAKTDLSSQANAPFPPEKKSGRDVGSSLSRIDCRPQRSLQRDSVWHHGLRHGLVHRERCVQENRAHLLDPHLGRGTLVKETARSPWKAGREFSKPTRNVVQLKSQRPNILRVLLPPPAVVCLLFADFFTVQDKAG